MAPAPPTEPQGGYQGNEQDLMTAMAILDSTSVARSGIPGRLSGHSTACVNRRWRRGAMDDGERERNDDRAIESSARQAIVPITYRSSSEESKQ